MISESAAPARRPGPLWLAPAIVFTASLALYAATLAPTVGFVDSGELSVAAWSFGVPHPPGTPLWVLLAHLATRVPVGSVAQRVNAASALFGALAAALIALAAALALSTGPRAPGGRASRGARHTHTRAPLDARPPSGSSEVLFPALAAGLLFAVGRTAWAYSTVAEVYTLSAAVVAGLFALVFHWRRLRLEGVADDRLLLAGAFLAGLGLGSHVVSVGVVLPGLVVLAVMTAGSRLLAPRRLLLAALCGLAGLSIYALLPLAASRDPVLDWGDPRDLERLIRHVSGQQYWVMFGASSAAMSGEIGNFVRLLLREHGPAWVPLGLLLGALGVAELSRRDRALLIALGAIAAFDVLYSVTYQIAEDKDAYYLPTFAVIALLAAFGAAGLRRRFRVPAAVALLAPALAVAANLPYADRSRFTLARDYAGHALSTVGRGGLLLTGDWQLYSPLFYLREVEGLRRDVVAVDTRLLRRSWYFDYLRRSAPELMAMVRPEVDAFLSDLRLWERDPKGFEREPSWVARIDERFFGMILAMIRAQLRAGGKAYASQDVVFLEHDDNARLGRDILQHWSVVPRGLVLELRGDTTFVRIPSPAWDEAALFRGRPRFEPDDVVSQKVIPVYAGMAMTRGRYLAGRGLHAEAAREFERSLALRPGFLAAEDALRASREALEAARTDSSASRP